MHVCLPERLGCVSCLFRSVWDAFDMRLEGVFASVLAPPPALPTHSTPTPAPAPAVVRGQDATRCGLQVA